MGVVDWQELKHTVQKRLAQRESATSSKRFIDAIIDKLIQLALGTDPSLERVYRGRRAQIQLRAANILFHILAPKGTFTTPHPEQQPLTTEQLRELLGDDADEEAAD